ncbi:hypothetical protein PWT90_06357 [Aphanocladium album]|nr:hypothetical protein PWT90_06357 [Aphanocladium album]
MHHPPSASQRCGTGQFLSFFQASFLCKWSSGPLYRGEMPCLMLCSGGAARLSSLHTLGLDTMRCGSLIQGHQTKTATCTWVPEPNLIDTNVPHFCILSALTDVTVARTRAFLFPSASPQRVTQSLVGWMGAPNKHPPQAGLDPDTSTIEIMGEGPSPGVLGGRALRATTSDAQQLSPPEHSAGGANAG